MGLAGIEPATSSLSGMRSNRLSYSPTIPSPQVRAGPTHEPTRRERPAWARAWHTSIRTTAQFARSRPRLSPRPLRRRTTGPGPDRDFPSDVDRCSDRSGGCRGTTHWRRARCDHAGVRRYVWTKDDPTGMEQVELSMGADGVAATSVAIGSVPVPYRLDFDLAVAADWVTRRLSLAAAGDGWTRSLVLERAVAGGGPGADPPRGRHRQPSTPRSRRERRTGEHPAQRCSTSTSSGLR